MKILNLGSCNIDHVYSLRRIVSHGETVMADRMDVFPGGKGLNQSIAISRGGGEVYHAGCIGNDGEMLRSILLDSGVDIRYLKTVDVKNGHAVIQVSSEGENCIIVHPGSNGAVTKEYIDDVLRDFGRGDMLVLQNEVTNVGYAVDRAYEKGMSILLNPSPINERLGEIDTEKITYMVLNETEMEVMSDGKGIDALVAKYPEMGILLTLGSRGCIWRKGDTVIEQRAFKVEAVDTTAAGDTFMGYFAAGLQRGEDMALVLLRAAAASAIAVSREGAAPSIPTLEETERFLTERKR